MVSSGTMLPSPPLPKKTILNTTPLSGQADAGRRVSPFASVLATGYDWPSSRSPGEKESRDKTSSIAVALFRHFARVQVHPQRPPSRNSGSSPNLNDSCSGAEASPFPRFGRVAQPWRGSTVHFLWQPIRTSEKLMPQLPDSLALDWTLE
jgi:hypothetical protein